MRPALALLLAMAMPGAAIQPAVPPPPGAGGTGSVSLDFLALSADGRPVVDLKPEEITLKVDGRARAVSSLRLVRAMEADASRGAGAQIEALPEPFGSNTSIDAARAVIIALDQESIRPGDEQRMRQEVGRFLVELAPRDRVALVTMPHGSVKVDLTTDHARIGQALAQIGGQAPRRQSAQEFACLSRRTLHSLTGLLEGLAGGTSPTTIIFLSAGLMGVTRDAPALGPPGPCEINPKTFEDVGFAANAARAQFYVVQPEEMLVEPGAVEIGFVGATNPRIGLEHLAGVTGGRLLRLAGSGDHALSRVALETSAYYVISFVPDAADRHGESRRVDVRASRADVVIRSRPAVTIARAEGRGARGITPRAMLREPKVYRDLPLRAIGYASKNAGDDRIKIAVVFESPDPSVRLASAAAGLFDAQGRLAAQWTANETELSRTPVISALLAPAGTYRLRVAAVDAAGRAGTVDHSVAADLSPAGPLKLSALVLGVARGGFAPRLQFGAEPVAIGYLEIFGLPTTAAAAVTFELAATVNGPALVSVPGVLTPTSDEDRHVATGALAIGSLPAGDFVVRAIVGAQGQPSGRVLRTLRKSL
jgi:VWFA-related protein